jgi:probable F420-dependent oxidoreductase
MRFGVPLPQFGPAADAPDVDVRIARTATLADRLGYDVLWTAEHFVFPPVVRTPYPYGDRFPYPVTTPFLDVGTTLAWVAGMTRRIRLSSAVQILPYHQPIAFAKAVATLDVLSGGRVIVGVATGWLTEEFQMLGVPPRERGVRMDEYLDVLRALWTEERVTFHGRFVRLDAAAFFPKPVQQPHPPIWIGGASAAAFARIARLGAGWIAPPPRDLDALAADVARLRALAEKHGRDPAAIAVASGGGARSVDELLDRLPALARAGVTDVTVPALFWAPDFERSLALLEEFAARAGIPAP